VKFIIPVLIAVFISAAAQADPPHLRDRQTGKYVGNLSANPYGQYGSRYSNDSPNNPYATNAPGIYGSDNEGHGY
jgi:hypothetical protein